MTAKETAPAATPETMPKSTAKPAAAAPKADGLKTEQEKGGKDPVSKAEPSPGPVETIEDQGIGPRDPYPTKEGG